ncbi:MAG: glycoside hydrolase family 97 protein [Candidatus Aminicenantes bacterium]|nr:glycoside hydrolase family 97 protein [Candidatus Aminicenantes bacterium]
MFALAARLLVSAPPALGTAADGREYSVFSPDKKIEFILTVGPDLGYSVNYEGRPLLSASSISMTVESGGTRIFGREARVKSAKRRFVDEVLRPVVRQKAASLPDRFNELTLQFAGDYGLSVRVYNDGAAYRFETSFRDGVTVLSERAEFVFPGDPKVWFPEEAGFQTHSERKYLYLSLSDITERRFASCPVVVETEAGPKVAVTESDLEDYAGMYLAGEDGSPGKLTGRFPGYPLKEEAKNDRNVPVTERASYLVKTSGRRTYPWRCLLIASEDGILIESPFVYRLAKPSSGDFSWVKPGKVAWDWWNALNLAGVDFRAGVNTATYKHFIDFAAENKIEYVILDEGWYKLGDLLSVVPEVNVEDIVAYGKTKGVGIILWAVWKTLDDQLENAMDRFSAWGIAGLKVDFMQRDDAWMVNYYYKIAAEAAKRRFLLDFHGAYKPTGLYRTFPNVLTSEGVMGLEHYKWSRDITPEHDVILPFTRMAAGPMDYTPGAMINGGLRNFQVIYNQPMSQGTRCRQLAMYVIYESPLQMLADSPSNYRREPECLEFLSAVPPVWDETRVLEARIGDDLLVARRSGSDWYIGAMTDEKARDLVLDLSFLDEGSFEMTLYRDGPNADRNGNDFQRVTKTVANADKVTLALAPGGGAAAILRPRGR